MFKQSNKAAIRHFQAIVVFVACVLMGIASSPANAETVRMGVAARTIDTFVETFALEADGQYLTPETCPTLGSEKLNNTGRILVEMVIVCNAVFEAGLADQIELIGDYPHKRMLAEISDGTIDMAGTTVFPEAFAALSSKTSPRASNPILRVNEFQKVIYTLPERADVLAVQNLEQLRTFSAIVVKYWAVDAKTLKTMKLKRVVEVSKQNLFPKFLQAGRADFALAAFLSHTNNPVFAGMVPIEGLKIALVSPRVIPISPTREDIVKAVNAYVDKARSMDGDQIVDAFRRAGFIDEQLLQWTQIFPAQ